MQSQLLTSASTRPNVEVSFETLKRATRSRRFTTTLNLCLFQFIFFICSFTIDVWVTASSFCWFADASRKVHDDQEERKPVKAMRLASQRMVPMAPSTFQTPAPRNFQELRAPPLLLLLLLLFRTIPLLVAVSMFQDPSSECLLYCRLPPFTSYFCRHKQTLLPSFARTITTLSPRQIGASSRLPSTGDGGEKPLPFALQLPTFAAICLCCHCYRIVWVCTASMWSSSVLCSFFPIKRLFPLSVTHSLRHAHSWANTRPHTL